jgi:hypothetical protein
MKMCDVCLRLWNEGKQKKLYAGTNSLGPPNKDGASSWQIDLCETHARQMAEAMNAAAQHHRTGSEMQIVSPTARTE